MSGKLHGSLGEGDIANTDGFIPKEVVDTLTSNGWVPLYYEGGQVIGQAKVTGSHMEVTIDDPTFMKALQENAIGFSTVTLDRDRAEDIFNKAKEKNDD